MISPTNRKILETKTKIPQPHLTKSAIILACHFGIFRLALGRLEGNSFPGRAARRRSRQEVAFRISMAIGVDY